MNRVLTLDTFMARMTEVTEEVGFVVDNYDETYIYITVNDQSLRLDLKAAYQAYTNSPERLDEIIASHRTSLNRIPPLSVSPVRAAPEALLPVLQTSQWLEEMRQQESSLIYRPFLTGLIIAYVIDMPTTERVYVTEAIWQDLLGNHKTLADVHTTALTNLYQRTKDYRIQTHGALYHTMISCETHEGYAAMCVLLPETMEQWARRIPDTMLIGIPNRDFIIAFSEKNPTGVAAMARQVSMDASSRQHALYGRLLVWRDGEVREYEPLH